MKDLALVTIALFILFGGSAYSQAGAGTEILNERAISWVRPDYPGIHFGPKGEEGYTVRVPGIVKVRVAAGKDGAVVMAEVVSGNETLSEAAKKAALLVKFGPLSSPLIGILVYTFADRPNDESDIKRCKADKFIICDEAVNALYEFKTGLKNDSPAYNAAIADVDKLLADFDKRFEDLKTGLAAKDATTGPQRTSNCLAYDKTGDLLKAIDKRLNQMTVEKLPTYEKGRAEYEKRVQLRKAIPKPGGCVLFV